MPGEDQLAQAPAATGGSILGVLQREEEKRKVDEREQFFIDMQKAGSREKALEVVKNYSARFSKPNDYTTAFRAVDEFYPTPPPPSREVKEFSIYNKQTGNESKRFLPSTETPSINNPAEFERRFGSEYTLTKPLRTPRTPADEDRDRAFARATLEKAARLSALSLNAKQLPDGSFTFDDDNRAKLWNDRLRLMREMLKKNEGLVMSPSGFIDLHTKSAKILPLSSEVEKPKEEPKPKPKSEYAPSELLKKFVDSVMGKEKPAAAEGGIEEQIRSKAAEINGRADLTLQQKQAAMKKLQEIAKKNGVKF